MAEEGTSFQALTLDQIVPLFPNLEIVDYIAVGGMGAVYKARQADLDRMVALKLLPAELGANAEYTERFRTEARAMAQLNHTNLVGIYDFGDASGYLFFVMEYVEGKSLAQLLETQKAFPPEFALPAMLHLCSGMTYALKKGVVHLDLKPGNLMLDNEGVIKILDFGLAKLLDPTTGSAVEHMGTADYAAPERFEGGGPIDHRADIYSLGVVLYEMLAGTPPDRENRKPISQLAAVDPSVNRVIDKCLETDPARRYQSFTELSDDITKVAKQKQNQSGPAPGGGKLLSGSPEMAAVARAYRKEAKRKAAKARFRNFVVILIFLAGLGFGALKLGFVPDSILTKVPFLATIAGKDPMFPELEKLNSQYETGVEAKVKELSAAEVATLVKNYENALRNLLETANQEENEELSQAIITEGKRVRQSSTASPTDSSFPELAKAQDVFRVEVGKIHATTEAKVRQVINQTYAKALTQLEEKLNAEGREADAKRVAEVRESL